MSPAVATMPDVSRAAALGMVLRLRTYRTAAALERSAGVESMLPAVIADLEYAIGVKLAALEKARQFVAWHLKDAGVPVCACGHASHYNDGGCVTASCGCTDYQPRGGPGLVVIPVDRLAALRVSLDETVATERLRPPVAITEDDARRIVRSRIADAALGGDVDHALLDAVRTVAPQLEREAS